MVLIIIKCLRSENYSEEGSSFSHEKWARKVHVIKRKKEARWLSCRIEVEHCVENKDQHKLEQLPKPQRPPLVPPPPVPPEVPAVGERSRPILLDHLPEQHQLPDNLHQRPHPRHQHGNPQLQHHRGNRHSDFGGRAPADYLQDRGSDEM